MWFSEEFKMPTLVELPADGSEADQEEMQTVQQLKVQFNFITLLEVKPQEAISWLWGGGEGKGY